MNNLSMRESATAQHELLLSWMEAGFSRKEAMELLKTMFAASVAAEQRKNNG